jgi:hypothetical protein
MFPGQKNDKSASIASSGIVSMRLFMRCAYLSHVMAHQSGMSSTRSRSGGIEIRKNVQPKIQVLAKLFVPNHLFQIPVGRSHHPYIHELRARAPQPLKFVFLQHP